MTYEEIIQAHECCSLQAKCVECPLYDTYGLNCIGILRQATFDLLHKQKAENEMLRRSRDRWREIAEDFYRASQEAEKE